MTTTRYIFARIAQAFGVNRRQRRMSEAASEMHLLREAEQVLGQSVWERVEEVEELGVEYWNLRKLIKEREEIRAKLTECEATLAEAHEQRSSLLNAKSDSQLELEEKRSGLLADLERLAKDRDSVIQQAREIRRVYDGLKMKAEVLQREGSSEAIDKTRSRMSELKTRFTDLKNDRDRIASSIAEGDSLVDIIDNQLAEERQKHRAEASVAFQQIGQANRDMSSLKAQQGLIDTQMRQLYSEIGRHVSRNAFANEQCKQAAKGHIPMIDVMRALRKSVAMNHRLAGM
jgi:chromosome segregation ATPase